MSNGEKNDQLTERQDEATDKRTLDEIEENESVSSDNSDSPLPSPDEGPGIDDDDDGMPM
jgi:hypothetical protein